MIQWFFRTTAIKFQRSRFISLLPTYNGRLFTRPTGKRRIPNRHRFANRNRTFFQQLITYRKRRNTNRNRANAQTIFQNNAFQCIRISRHFIRRLNITARLLRIQTSMTMNSLNQFLRRIARLPNRLRTPIRHISTNNFSQRNNTTRTNPNGANSRPSTQRRLLVTRRQRTRKNLRVLKTSLSRLLQVIRRLSRHLTRRLTRLFLRLTRPNFTNVPVSRNLRHTITSKRTNFHRTNLIRLLKPRITLNSNSFFFDSVTKRTGRFRTIRRQSKS